MEYSHTALEKHFHSMGKVQKFEAWVPHAENDGNSDVNQIGKAIILLKLKYALFQICETYSYLKGIKKTSTVMSYIYDLDSGATIP